MGSATAGVEERVGVGETGRRVGVRALPRVWHGLLQRLDAVSMTNQGAVMVQDLFYAEGNRRNLILKRHVAATI